MPSDLLFLHRNLDRQIEFLYNIANPTDTERFEALVKRYTQISEVQPGNLDRWLSMSELKESLYPQLICGLALTDNGNLFFTQDEYKKHIEKFGNENHFVKIINGNDLVNDTYHYWLKLDTIPLSELNDEEIRLGNLVKEFRKVGGHEARGKYKTPYKPLRNRVPKSDYLAIVKTFGSSHTSVPCKMYPKDMFYTSSLFAIENPSDEIIKIIKSREFLEYVRQNCQKTSANSLTVTTLTFYSYLKKIDYHDSLQR
jgi:hypothetical protein